MSQGSEQLLEIVKEIFPNQKIELEYNVADRGGLYIDIFLPRFNIGFEFDGIQHFKFIEHFHGSRQHFLRARRLDGEKDQKCNERGIKLIRLAYNEPMTKEYVTNKIEEALDG